MPTSLVATECLTTKTNSSNESMLTSVLYATPPSPRVIPSASRNICSVAKVSSADHANINDLSQLRRDHTDCIMQTTINRLGRQSKALETTTQHDEEEQMAEDDHSDSFASRPMLNSSTGSGTADAKAESKMHGKANRQKIHTVHSAYRELDEDDREYPLRTLARKAKLRAQEKIQKGESDHKLVCTCRQVENGEMIDCAGKDCTFKRFHCNCVGVKTPKKGKWYCRTCTESRSRTHRRYTNST